MNFKILPVVNQSEESIQKESLGINYKEDLKDCPIVLSKINLDLLAVYEPYVEDTSYTSICVGGHWCIIALDEKTFEKVLYEDVEEEEEEKRIKEINVKKEFHRDNKRKYK